MASSSLPKPARRPGARSRRSVSLVAFALGVLVALPLLIAASGLLWQHLKQDGATPRWITPAVIYASSSDGMSVKAKVSLDIADADARGAVEHHLDQVNLLLQATVAAHTRDELAAEGGLEALADDMRDKLNDYLGVDDDKGVRSVVVGDIFYSRP